MSPRRRSFIITRKAGRRCAAGSSGRRSRCARSCPRCSFRGWTCCATSPRPCWETGARPGGTASAPPRRRRCCATAGTSTGAPIPAITSTGSSRNPPRSASSTPRPKRQTSMTGSSRCVALLPMKANSQRVPGKNFRPLHGKPLFRWILDALLALEEIDAVVIDTDARAILAENGLTDGPRVRIRDRRPELCGDTVSMNLILADDIAAVEAETYLMTHTTNPLLGPATIRAALARYRAGAAAGEADSLFTVNKVQTRFYRADGSPVNHDPDNLIQTQDLEPWFEENSNLYIFSAGSFAATGARIGRKPILHEMDPMEALDIDTPADWALAEAVATMPREAAE